MKKTLFHFYITFMPLVLFSSLALALVTDTLYIMVVAFCIFYAFTLIKAMILYGPLSLYSIFLYTSFFFVYSRIYFDLFGYASFLTIVTPVIHTFSEGTGYIFLTAAFLAQFCIDVVFSLSYKPAAMANTRFQCNSNLQKTGVCMMLAAFPVLMYKLLLIILFVREHGYLSIYTGELDSLSLPFWTKGSGTVFVSGYLLLVMSGPSRKIFLRFSALFLVCLLAGSFRGARSSFLTPMMAVLVLYAKLYPVKTSVPKLIFTGFFVVAFTVFMGVFRSNSEVKVNVFDLALIAIYRQGASIGPALVFMENKGAIPYHTFPFIFSPIARPFIMLAHPQTGTNIQLRLKNQLEYNNEVGTISEYMLAPRMYYNGSGLGGSFIAETYDFFGFFGVVFWSVILALLLAFIENKLRRGSLFVPILYPFILTIIYLPRFWLFGFLESIHYALFSITVLIFAGFMFYPSRVHFQK